MLNSEVDFLRKEMASKDKIIELLIKEKSNYNGNIGDKDNKQFEHPKKANHDGINIIPVKNSFNPLAEQNTNTDERTSTETTKKTITKYRSTTIIGDSLIRDIKQQRIRKDLPGNKVFIKSFSGATTACLNDYVKPSLRYKPDLLIIHGGTNDLRSEKTSKQIAEKIVTLASDVKTEENDVIISGIVRRNDELNTKGQEVNHFLKLLCSELNMGYLDNSCIESKHLNASGSHLTYSGTVALANNFIKQIKL